MHEALCRRRLGRRKDCEEVLPPSGCPPWKKLAECWRQTSLRKKENEETWNRSRSWKGNWERNTWSRQRRTRSDGAFSFPAEAQNVMMETEETAPSADWRLTVGSSVPSGMKRVGRPIAGRYPTPRECREQRKEDGFCVFLSPRTKRRDEWTEDWISLHCKEEDLRRFEEAEWETQRQRNHWRMLGLLWAIQRPNCDCGALRERSCQD